MALTDGTQLALSRGLSEMTRGTAVTVNSSLRGRRCRRVKRSSRISQSNSQSVEEAASQFVKQFRPTSLLQRASVEEIANMVAISASKEASATNGALRAEGGIVLADHCLR
jgi:hypothetical protein